jgi:hypothetical protein
MEWVLKACDLNKDIEIDDICQMVLPDIQLKYVNRVHYMIKQFIEQRSHLD